MSNATASVLDGVDILWPQRRVSPVPATLSADDVQPTARASDCLETFDTLSGPRWVYREVVVVDRNIRLRLSFPFIEGQEPTWFNPTLEALFQLLWLPEGWNHHRGKQICPRAVLAAVTLLAQTMRSDSPPPLVVPTAPGGVQLEWHRNRVDLEITICPLGRMEASYENLDAGYEWDEVLATDFARLTNAIDEISG